MDRLLRHPERGSAERTDLDALLDSQWHGVLSTVADGQPWAVPLLYARDGDRIILHGSTGAGALRAVATGAQAVFTVTALDALVVGHTTFESSANYRSATIRGRLARATGEDQARALDLFSDALLPGRTGEVRPTNKKEWAATLVTILPIEEGHWLYKARTGWPCDEAESDATKPVHGALTWAGIVPVHTSYGPAQPAPWVRVDPPRSVERIIGGS